MFVFIFFLLLILFFGAFDVADVDKFYQQCDPGGFEILLSSLSVSFFGLFSLCAT